MPTINVSHFKTDYSGLLIQVVGGETRYHHPGAAVWYERLDWQKKFASEKVFTKRRSSDRGILDWETGSINIAYALRSARYKATAALQRIARQTDEAEALVNAFAKSEDIMDTGLVAVLRPYHGNPVVVPEDWLEASPLESDRTEAADDFPGLPPAERILALLEGNPTMKKAEIKEALFPGASERRFHMYWEMAAQARPEISRPGRKRTRV